MAQMNYNIPMSDAGQQAYNQCNVISSLRDIAENHGIIKFVKIESGDEYCLANGEDAYINRSYLVGSDQIYLGIYSDEQLLIASFFHELGHIIKSKNGKYNSETIAWLVGFKLAKQYGFEFTTDVYLWAIEQLSTYDKDETRFKL